MAKVVGAGVAGAVQARAPAERGVRATVIDERDPVAGNRFGRVSACGRATQIESSRGSRAPTTAETPLRRASMELGRGFLSTLKRSSSVTVRKSLARLVEKYANGSPET